VKPEEIPGGRRDGERISIVGRAKSWTRERDSTTWLSDLVKGRRIDLESVDVSVVSFEQLCSLLLNESASVESEDALFRLILNLSSGYRDQLRHIQIG
jgi:hypothetical protein